jgi:hypothetical protein
MMKRISVYGRRPGEKSEDMIMTTLHMGTELEERWSGMGWKEKKKKKTEAGGHFSDRMYERRQVDN